MVVNLFSKTKTKKTPVLDELVEQGFTERRELNSNAKILGRGHNERILYNSKEDKIIFEYNKYQE